ncbi:MAG: hypothetical protein ABSF81_00010 [Bacteroidales bacterium]|jgi:chromosome segregation ATPase
MDIGIIATVIGALSSLLAGVVFSETTVRKLLFKLFRLETPKKTYSQRLAELISNLSKSTKEVDSVINEITFVIKEREASVTKLESDLQGLSAREKELKERIETLEKVPISAADYFAKLVNTGEKRSAKRDYLLFGIGVIVTTTIAVLIQLFS